MNINVTTHIDTDKILRTRGLGSSREAAEALAVTVADLCEPYIPVDTGALRRSCEISSGGEAVCIIYNVPYAIYQYYGKEWDRRMMADKKGEVISSLADFVGGIPK